MKRFLRSAVAPFALWGAVLGGWILPALPARGADAGPQDARIQAHLDVGEFAPALRLARQAGDRRQGDAWLARIAQAQAQVGARDAALRTAGEVSDDRARADLLRRLAAHPLGARGGGTQADFDPLIELITTTIQPPSWDAAGGPGAISPFPTGVWVDAQGVLKPLLLHDGTDRLAALRQSAAVRGRFDKARRRAELRMVSLPRLEKHVQLALAAGRQPSEEMQLLAGLQRIEYLFVYPETGEIVLAGPAGDWRIDAEDRAVSLDTGLPVVRLDDLVVVLRHALGAAEAKFGCLIVPRQEGLARLKEFVEKSSAKPIQPSQRKAWLEQLRSQLGKQDVEVHGLDPRTRAARVMVEADYRMKLVGMGIEKGVPGVKSYLDSIQVGPNQSPPPMGVLRWWFTLNYDAAIADPQHLAFEFRGQGVKVLSENERLTAEGQRIHTGESEELNRRFARSFSDNFPALCEKYPIYAELRNLFDLALVSALIRAEDLPAKCRWHLTCFGDPQAYRVELAPAPKEVESVVHHRVINQKHVVAGVSGGVACNPAPLVEAKAIRPAASADLAERRVQVRPQPAAADAWWWDAP